ncbi:M43 family zinc metalloprotease [Arthrobacter sp. ov407]|uniref:M43 family zinc metalloprotease n=1 Tax=Arthrobacter sp. ov407 TaxID=1761748 RepID=UPI0015A4A288|nr:M43 family zinc metalloprotease [Arthrobacter sp. ov407]
MKTALFAALVLALASVPATGTAPAHAEQSPTPVATATATAPATATASATATAAPAATPTAPPTPEAPAPGADAVQPTPSPSSTAGASPSLTTVESLPVEGSDEPFIAHTFENPPPVGKKGAPAGAAATSLSTESYSLARSGDIKVRLALVQLADKKATISQATAQAAITTTSSYWKTMSNDRLSMTVTKVESRTSKATSTQRYPDMMNTIAGELGWTPSPYTALVVFVSTPAPLSDGAYGAGWSYNGTSGKVIMPLPGALTNSVLTHEFGHVLGLNHAQSLQCGSGAQDVATKADGTFADSSCSIREYGDSLDLMGVSQSTRPAISSTLWTYGGFGRGDEILDAGVLKDVKKFTLKAWAGTDARRAVKFTDPVSGEVYFLELRLPVGYDTAKAVNLNSGVKIVQPLGAYSLVLLPDSRPFAGYYNPSQTWQAGQTFSTHAGTRVKIDSISATAAAVTITAANAVTGVFRDAWLQAGGETSLGYSTSDVTCPYGAAASTTCHQAFQRGVVYSTPGVGTYAVKTAYMSGWKDAGWQQGIGYPTGAESCGLYGGGCYQPFQKGNIYYSTASGAHAVVGVYWNAWRDAGWQPGIGYPTGAPSCGLYGGGCFQPFQKGNIYYSTASGAHAVAGAYWNAWKAAGWQPGIGYPTGDPVCGLSGGGCSQSFQKGNVYYTAATGAHAVSGAYATAWTAAGRQPGMGYPTGAPACGLYGGGCFQPFQKGNIYYSTASGAHAVTGAYWNAWREAGWQPGIGYPTGDPVCGLSGGGCSQSFQKGNVYYTAATGAHAVSGAYATAWTAAGRQPGIGYPIGAPTCGLYGGGCYQPFEKSNIYYSTASGAHAVTSRYFNSWRAAGFQKGVGYPTGPEKCGLYGGGCYQPFERGNSYYTAATGANMIGEPYRNAWRLAGWQSGGLGYPLAAAVAYNGYRTVPFQGGSMIYSATGVKVVRK